MNISEFVCVDEEDPAESFRIIPSSAYQSMTLLCKSASAVSEEKSATSEKTSRLSRLEAEEFELIDGSDLIQDYDKMTREELLGLICREFEQQDLRCFRFGSARRLVKTVFKSSIAPEL